tara:strand:+ start:593 stop:1381 length:789 start_codon:yes stop_codon:yes gene_type:complete
MSDQIDIQEARDIVRLIGEVALTEASRNDRRKLLMDGLARMIGADAWLWFTAAHTLPGELPVFTFLLRNGLSDEQFTLLMSAADAPGTEDLMAPFFSDLNATGSLTTRLQQQIVSTVTLEESAAYELWRKADIGPAILSARPTSDGQVSMIGLYRSSEKPLFCEKESRIAHIVLSEIPSLHEDISPVALNGGVLDLSPRLRQVLNCLLQGFSRKEIASHLELSVYTLGGYISEIYKRFDVHSQSTLIRRFLAGDGGDLPSSL